MPCVLPSFTARGRPAQPGTASGQRRAGRGPRRDSRGHRAVGSRVLPTRARVAYSPGTGFLQIHGDTVAMRTLRVQAGPSLCPLQASLVTHTGRGKTLPAPGAELVTVLVTRTLAPGWELTCLTRHSPPGQVHRHK